MAKCDPARMAEENAMSAAKNVKRVPTLCYNCVSGPDFMKVKVEDGVATEIEPNSHADETHQPEEGAR